MKIFKKIKNKCGNLRVVSSLYGSADDIRPIGIIDAQYVQMKLINSGASTTWYNESQGNGYEKVLVVSSY